MLYDNRQYPHAVTLGEKMHVVWRGEDGLPYCAYYDLQGRSFSEPVLLTDGYEDEIDTRKYRQDHHFAPVIWSDQDGYLHTLFGCHRTTGIHLVSEKPSDSTQWRRGIDFSESISYPKIHRIYDDKTLVYTRYSGHLGFWQYHVSNDGGNTWQGGGRPVVNLGAEPQDGLHAAFSGSYNTTAVSKDGTRIHVAFIWKVEDPLHNKRYDAFLNDHLQRYNLYYLYVDLPTGRGYNIDGEEIELPVRKKVADEKCLVWDTEERVAAVGPSICLNEMDKPAFLLPVSEETPTDSSFYFVSREQGKWRKTRITKTLHPFNASCLQLDEQGVYRAFMITGSGEEIIKRVWTNTAGDNVLKNGCPRIRAALGNFGATSRRYQACVTRIYSLSLMAWSESGRTFSYSMVGEMRIAWVLGTFGIPANKAITLIEPCVIMAQ